MEAILLRITDYGHPERAFLQKPETFVLVQTNWAEFLEGIWVIFGTISTFGHCESLAHGKMYLVILPTKNLDITPE